MERAEKCWSKTWMLGRVQRFAQKVLLCRFASTKCFMWFLLSKTPQQLCWQSSSLPLAVSHPLALLKRRNSVTVCEPLRPSEVVLCKGLVRHIRCALWLKAENPFLYQLHFEPIEVRTPTASSYLKRCILQACCFLGLLACIVGQETLLQARQLAGSRESSHAGGQRVNKNMNALAKRLVYCSNTFAL